MYSTKSVLKKSPTKRMLLTTLVGVVASVSILTNTANGANQNANNMPVDISSMQITTHELALMQVLSEICPKLLRQNQQSSFQHAYNTKLQALMPNISNPQNALQYLSAQKDYRDLHHSIKTWTLSFSEDENQALCEDIADSDF